MNAILKFVLFLCACCLGAFAMAIGLNLGADVYQAKLRLHVQNRLLPKPAASEDEIAE
ncbi:MAG: hypothetical protein WCX65_15420 [bacterium]